jgi:Apea-like HEPN
MTCLESLFNLGRDQITHTVSRHLSIILSTNATEFQLNYKRIKKLYGIRSTIVHGGTTNEKIEDVTYELQDKVSKAMLYCFKTDLNKSELFDKLNQSGY